MKKQSKKKKTAVAVVSSLLALTLIGSMAINFIPDNKTSDKDKPVIEQPLPDVPERQVFPERLVKVVQ